MTDSNVEPGHILAPSPRKGQFHPTLDPNRVRPFAMSYDDSFAVWSHGCRLFYADRLLPSLLLFNRLSKTISDPTFTALLSLNVGLIQYHFGHAVQAQNHFIEAHYQCPELCLPPFLLGLVAHQNSNYRTAFHALKRARTNMRKYRGHVNFSKLGFELRLDLAMIKDNIDVARQHVHLSDVEPSRRATPPRPLPTPIPLGTLFGAPHEMYAQSKKVIFPHRMECDEPKSDKLKGSKKSKGSKGSKKKKSRGIRGSVSGWQKRAKGKASKLRQRLSW